MEAMWKSEKNNMKVRPSSRKTIFAIPIEPDPYFVFRDAISSPVKDQFERYRRAVLRGMGGTGYVLYTTLPGDNWAY